MNPAQELRLGLLIGELKSIVKGLLVNSGLDSADFFLSGVKRFEAESWALIMQVSKSVKE